MSEITTIPSSAGATHLPALARFFAGLRGFKLRPDLVLIGVAGLFGGLGVYSSNQAIATARYVAHELDLAARFQA
jgi:hypothetical protein